MPALSAEQNKLDIKSAKKKKTETSGDQTSKSTSSKPPKKKPPKSLIKDLGDDFEDTARDEEEDEEDDEDDDVINASLNRKKDGQSRNLIFGVAGVCVVIIVVILFLLIRGNARRNNRPADDTPPPTQVEQTPVVEPKVPAVVPDDINVGTQDFRGNTTMDSDMALTDPDSYTKDIYGLTLRTNFTVSKIQTATDFVNYTKCRGTWGGGLELYWLDCEYKNNKYVIQVPFKYFKELDDTGIVPVKMEVLRIANEAGDGYLSVISYMCLDEKTLESVLKTQTK